MINDLAIVSLGVATDDVEHTGISSAIHHSTGTDYLYSNNSAGSARHLPVLIFCFIIFVVGINIDIVVGVNIGVNIEITVGVIVYVVVITLS